MVNIKKILNFIAIPPYNCPIFVKPGRIMRIAQESVYEGQGMPHVYRAKMYASNGKHLDIRSNVTAWQVFA
jgi:hypothetical protein